MKELTQQVDLLEEIVNRENRDDQPLAEWADELSMQAQRLIHEYREVQRDIEKVFE